jgi:hypothetical protein
MALNKFTDTNIKEWMKIGCQEFSCNQLDMPNGTCVNAYDMCVQNDLKVDGITDIAGNNYATPDLGQPAYSLHTDGLGATYWDVDSAGSGDISYNGTPPTIPGQLLKFSGVDGKTAEQSTILDSDLLLKNGAVAMTGDLDLGNYEIKNCTHLSGMEITPAEFIVNPRSVQSYNLNVQAVLNTNVIEPTSLPWVRIEECEIEDRKIRCDNVDEKTLNNGVNVDGVLLKDGGATLGSGDNRYLLPNTSAGVPDGAVLAFNVATKDMEFKDKWNFTTQFGGNVNNTGNYFVPLADPNFATNGTLDNTKEIIVPVDSYMERLTYSTSTGDATSTLQIVVDGLNPLQFIFTLGGAQGVLNITRQPNRLLSAGTRVAIRMNGGSSVGGSNLTCVFRS